MTVFFPFVPDWSSSYKITREFKTDIIVSRSGFEQRRALRLRPRKQVAFQVQVIGTVLRLFNAYMSKAASGALLVPDFSRSVLTNGMASGGTTLTADTAPWISGSVALHYANLLESRIVTSFVANVATFVDSTTTTWPGGTRLHPLLKGRIPQELSGSLLTDGVEIVSLALDVEPGSELAESVPDAVFVYLNREILLSRPNYTQAQQIRHQGPSEIVDFGYGLIDVFNPIAFNSRIHQATYLQMNLQDMVRLENVFLRACGRQGEFYGPTWQNDLPIAAGAAYTSTTFQVPGTYTQAAYSADPVFKDFLIAYRDGTYGFNTAAGLTVSGSNTLVECAHSLSTRYTLATAGGTEAMSAATVAFDPAAVSMICWMPVCRFGSDSMTTEWLTDQVAQSQLSIVTLPYQDPET